MRPGGQAGELILEQQPAQPLDPSFPVINDLSAAEETLAGYLTVPLFDPSTPYHSPAAATAINALLDRIVQDNHAQHDSTLSADEAGLLREAATKVVSERGLIIQIIAGYAAAQGVSFMQAAEDSLDAFHPGDPFNPLVLGRWAAAKILARFGTISALSARLRP